MHMPYRRTRLPTALSNLAPRRFSSAGLGLKSAALALVAALGCGAAMAQAAGQASTQGPAVPVATVALRPVGSAVVLDGTLQAVRQSTLSAQANGRIAQLNVKAGDRVRAGQVLAVIDDRVTQAGVAQAQAGVAQAQAGRAQALAQLQDAQAHFKRTQELHTQGFVSKSALEMAEARLKVAQAGAQQAQAGEAQAVAGQTQSSLAQGYTRLTAPYDGFVMATHAEAGDLAAPGVPVLTVYAPQPLRAVAHVPASQAGLAQRASRIEIGLPQNGGMAWVAPVARTRLPAADPVSQTVEWRLELAAENAAQLIPGQQVSVRFVAGDEQRLVLPASAVLRRGELTAVYVVPAGTTGSGFALRAVRLGASHGEAGVEVLSGVKAGDTVALDPVRAGLAGARPAP
jgi:RND family efflux transporter MFP subunit